MSSYTILPSKELSRALHPGRGWLAPDHKPRKAEKPTALWKEVAEVFTDVAAAFPLDLPCPPEIEADVRAVAAELRSKTPPTPGGPLREALRYRAMEPIVFVYSNPRLSGVRALVRWWCATIGPAAALTALLMARRYHRTFKNARWGTVNNVKTLSFEDLRLEASPTPFLPQLPQENTHQIIHNFEDTTDGAAFRELRAMLVEVDDATYAATRAVAAEAWPQQSFREKVLTAYLFPTEQAWGDEVVADFLTRGTLGQNQYNLAKILIHFSHNAGQLTVIDSLDGLPCLGSPANPAQVIAALKTRTWNRWIAGWMPMLAHLEGPGVAEELVRSLVMGGPGDKATAPAEAWLKAHPAEALRALNGAQNSAAEMRAQLLRAHPELAEAQATAAPPATEAPAPALSAYPAELQVAHGEKLPANWKPEAWGDLMLPDGRILPLSAIKHLGQLVGAQKRAALTRVGAALEPSSLQAFWSKAARMAVESGTDFTLVNAWIYMQESAALDWLEEQIPLWWSGGRSSRVSSLLSSLSAHESLGTLRMLQRLALKARNSNLRSRAADMVQNAAHMRRLSPMALQDRLVPDLGLDAAGQRTLNFGPRSFVVSLDEQLQLVVSDSQGKRLKDLPKPNQSDDPALSAAAVATWKELKKDSKAAVSEQRTRLEQAMVDGHTWTVAEFQGVVLSSPLMRVLVRRLLWTLEGTSEILAGSTLSVGSEPRPPRSATERSDGAEPPAGGASRPSGREQGEREARGGGTPPLIIRIDEAGGLADQQDDPVSWPAAGQLRLVHPVELSAEQRQSWGKVFADYQIVQPFPQLSREVFTSADRDRVISALPGRKVQEGALRGLMSQGWVHGSIEDAGMFYGLRYRKYNVEALIEHSGMSISLFQNTPVELRGVVVKGPDGRALSELLRQLNNLR